LIMATSSSLNPTRPFLRHYLKGNCLSPPIGKNGLESLPI
jgi:hypothetical protein